MDGMNGTDWAELQAEQQAERDARDAARMRHEARRHTYATLYLGRAWRVEANLDAEYGAEWTLNEASQLADENATLTAQPPMTDQQTTDALLALTARIGSLKSDLAAAQYEMRLAQAERDRMSIALNRAERAIDDLQDQLAAQAVAK